MRDSRSPLIRSISTPVRSWTSLSTALPLGASRIALVANDMISVTPESSAICRDSWMKPTSAAVAASSIVPSLSRCSASRSSSLCETAGTGAAPWWASITSRWAVFEPISSTPSRMASG